MRLITALILAVVLVLLSVVLHEGIHVLQIELDDRITFSRIALVDNVNFIGLNLTGVTGWGIGVFGNYVDGLNSTEIEQYESEKPVREYQAYGVQIIFLFIAVCFLLRAFVRGIKNEANRP